MTDRPVRAIPTCYMDEDGEHFWFDHECADVAVEWAAGGHPLSEEGARQFQDARNHTMLPLGPEGWTVVSKDPLTISPSILCCQCNVHGFFREGKWVPA